MRVELKWFLMWLSVLPGSSFAISDHLFPYFKCAYIIFISSSSVHLFFFISGFRWLCHLQRLWLMSVTFLYIAFQFDQVGALLFESIFEVHSFPQDGELDDLLLQSKDPWLKKDWVLFTIYANIRHPYGLVVLLKFFSSFFLHFFSQHQKELSLLLSSNGLLCNLIPHVPFNIS